MVEVRADEIGARVHRARTSAGLSQAELAERAGVSRQALGALEHGRHLPRIDAAVALARALGTSVEALVGAGSVLARHVLFRPLPDRTPVRAARVGERVVAVEVPADGSGEAWAAPDGVVHDGGVLPLDTAELDGFVLVGCDPALGVMADLAPRAGPGRLLVVSASSAAATRALTAGRAHAAVVHDREDHDREDHDDPATQLSADRERSPTGTAAPGSTSALPAGHPLPFARWRTGIAAPADAPELLDAALTGSSRVVQRESGAAAQAAFERALASRDAARPAGPVAVGHLDAARRAVGEQLPAVTIEPVARALGLSFQPLETHRVTLVIGEDHVEHAGARTVAELLGSARLRRHVTAFGGYELGDLR